MSFCMTHQNFNDFGGCEVFSAGLEARLYGRQDVCHHSPANKLAERTARKLCCASLTKITA
jgi:hypothetical protein